MYICVHVLARVLVWSSENDLLQRSVFFYLVEPGD